ncbi:MAG: hypothetical protein AAB799_00940, partial [Patescibacteria group bacterium]
GFKLIIIFVSAIIADGLILPGLFGFNNSLLSLLVIVTPVVHTGLTNRYIFYSLVFSILYEWSGGLDFGALAIPFLITAVVIFFIQKFFDIKNKHLIFSALISVVFFYLLLFFYNRGLDAGYLSLTVILTVLSEALILVFVLNAIFKKSAASYV